MNLLHKWGVLTACRDVTAPQRHAALGADQVQTPKVVPLAQWVLLAILTVNGEELGRDYNTTVLTGSQRIDQG